MKTINLIRAVIFITVVSAMFLSVTHSVLGLGEMPPIYICTVAAYLLSLRFDNWAWSDCPGCPIFMLSGLAVGLLTGFPIRLYYDAQ